MTKNGLRRRLLLLLLLLSPLQISAKARAKPRAKARTKPNLGTKVTNLNLGENSRRGGTGSTSPRSGPYGAGGLINEFDEEELDNVVFIGPGSENSLIKPFKNGETKLLADLLDGYNPDARPVIDFKDSVQVNFTVSLIRIVDLNTKTQELTTSIWLNYIWKDNFLQWNPDNYMGVNRILLPIDKIWRPDILLYNSVSENFDPSYKTNAVINHDGMVNWLPPAMITSSCKVDVQYYPFDHQDCKLLFGPWSHNMQMLNVSIMGEPDVSMYEKSNKWQLNNFTVSRQEVKFESTPNDPPYVYITYNLQLKRYKKWGNQNFIYPVLITCVMALCVFLLPADAGEKVGLSITTLLALVVFMQMLSAETPPTADTEPTPGIQTFFMSTLVMVCMSTIATVLQLFLHHRDTGIQDPVLPDPFRYLLVKFLPQFLFLKPFEGNGSENLRWFNGNLPFCGKMPSDEEGSSGGGDGGTEASAKVSVPEELFITQSQDSDCSQQLSEHAMELLKILTELRKLTSFLADEEKKNEGGDEWKYCAIVFDRFCLYLFTVVTSVLFWCTIGTHALFDGAPQSTEGHGHA